MYRYFFKPLLDFLISFLGLIILSPFFLILILAIKIDSKGPVLFKQNRIGKNKKIFKIYKFRTMKIDTPKDVPTHLLDNPAQYITRVGKFLRKTSLDELPQILNILFGKMSIIGPRPALWNQDDLIAERDKYNVNSLRPGLSGWAQVNGRDELAIPVKAKFDGEYVGRIGFFFDIKIFFMTVAKVFKADGVVEGKTDEPLVMDQDIEIPEEQYADVAAVIIEEDNIKEEEISTEDISPEVNFDNEVVLTGEHNIEENIDNRCE